LRLKKYLNLLVRPKEVYYFNISLPGDSIGFIAFLTGAIVDDNIYSPFKSAGLKPDIFKVGIGAESAEIANSGIGSGVVNFHPGAGGIMVGSVRRRVGSPAKHFVGIIRPVDD